MAIPYSEPWAAGNSDFSSMYRYDKPPEAVDPLYPFIRAAEGVYINGDGRLDKNPVWTGEFETYQQAGIWFKAMGPLNGGGPGAHGTDGFWPGTVGCIQCTYYPTTESLAEIEALGDFCPLVMVGTPQLGQSLIGVSADLESGLLSIDQSNDGSHAGDIDVSGAPMPVAGEAYTVRMGWQCGTYDEDTGSAQPDGFLRISINGELVYEAVEISLLLNFLTVPGNLIDSVLFGLAGLLGPLDAFTISDSECTSVSPIVFQSGRVSFPVAWAKLLLKVTP